MILKKWRGQPDRDMYRKRHGLISLNGPHWEPSVPILWDNYDCPGTNQIALNLFTPDKSIKHVPGTLYGKLSHLLRNFWTAELRSSTAPYIYYSTSSLVQKPDCVFCIFGVYQLVKNLIFTFLCLPIGLKSRFCIFSVYGFEDSSSISVVISKIFRNLI